MTTNLRYTASATYKFDADYGDGDEAKIREFLRSEGWTVHRFERSTDYVEVPMMQDRPPYPTLPGATTVTVDVVMAGEYNTTGAS